MVGSIGNEYKCSNCGDLMIHPYHIDDNDNDKYFCQICIQNINDNGIYIVDKKLERKLKNELNIPLTVYKQMAMNKSVIKKRMEILDEYFIQREKELNDIENGMSLGQQIMNHQGFAHKMAGY